MEIRKCESGNASRNGNWKNRYENQKMWKQKRKFPKQKQKWKSEWKLKIFLVEIILGMKIRKCGKRNGNWKSEIGNLNQKLQNQKCKLEILKVEMEKWK